MRGVLKTSFVIGITVMMLTGTLVGISFSDERNIIEPIIQNTELADFLQPNAGSEATLSDMVYNPMKGTVKVIVATTDVAELARGLSAIQYSGTLGENAAPGLAFPILELPIDSLTEVEAIDGVLGVYPFQEASTESNGGESPEFDASAIPPVTSAYTGQGATVAVLDTGIDFSHPGLANKYATVPAKGQSVREPIYTPSNETISTVFLNYANVNAGTVTIFVNGNPLNATDYTVNLATGQVTFSPAIVAGSGISASYIYDSPYAGWPQAYDPASMRAYVDSNGEATLSYVNTTYNGTGPFEARHTILLDGESDFAGSEVLDNDKNTYIDMSDPSYNLDRLEMSRDINNIYAGFLTYAGNPEKNENVSYAMYFDMDGSTSGALSDPRGNYIDTASSHANWVNYVRMSPDGSKVASLGGGKPYQAGQVGEYLERLVRIWAPDGTLEKSLEGHVLAPLWAAWTPGNVNLVTADLGYFYVWDTDSGEMLRQVNYAEGYHPTALVTGQNPRAIIDVSPNNGTIVAIAGDAEIGIWNIDGNWIKDIPLQNGVNAHSVAFDPNGINLAVSLSNGTFSVYNVNTGALVLTKPNVHTGAVLSVKWNSDGTMIATGSLDQTLKTWSYPAGTLLYSWPLAFAANDIAWSLDSSKIAIATSFTQPDHNRVVVYNTATHALLTSILHNGGVNSVDWRGNTIISASKDTKLRAIDVSSADPAQWAVSNIFYSHKVDYALYFNHRGTEWGLDEEGEVWSNNDTFYTADLYRWTGAAWGLLTGATNNTIGISKTNSVYLLNNTLLFGGKYYEIFEENSSIMYNGEIAELTINKIDVAYNDWLTWPSAEGYVEASIPRNLLGDADSMEVTLFSTANVPSRPQDTVPADPNVELNTFNSSTSTLSLSAFVRFTPPIIYINSTAIPSMSIPPRYHIGFHPDMNMATTGIVGVLLADPNVAGRYDTVVVDGNMDMVFDLDDPVLNKAAPVTSMLYTDKFGQNTTYASGLLYFIADGKNTVPYLRTYMGRYAGFDENFTRDFVPGNGEMICLNGEFERGSSHGTNAASVIESVAPDAKLVLVGDMTEASFFDALFFAAEGYDGSLGSSDDIDIAYTGVKYDLDPEAGWDVYSKFADWISAIYTNNSLTIVAGAGDRGFGYGTISSPGAAPSVITVGWCQDYSVETGSAGPYPKSGDISPTSARGPTFAGTPKPDILDLGQVNAANPYPSSSLWNTWYGSDAAAARAVGNLAVISQAYTTAHSGAAANAPTLKRLLMSGADTLALDSNTQGAGLVNLVRSLQLANTTAGISVSPSAWTPGDWGGSVWASAPAVLSPGGTANTTFTLTNEYNSIKTASVSAGQYKKVGELSSSLVPLTTNGASSWTILINETGVYKPDGSGGLVRISSMSQTVWNLADNMKIRANAPWDEVYLDEAGYVYLDHKFELAVYDLTAYSGTPFPLSSMNAFGKMGNTNSLQIEVKNPARRSSDGNGIVVTLKHQTAGELVEITNWTVDIEFYSWDEWGWINVAPQSVSLGADSTGTFTATATVPANAEAGTHDGAISIKAAPMSVTNEVVSEYPIYKVDDELLGIYSYTDFADQEILGDPIGGETTATIVAADPITPGTVDLWLERYWTNATWIYNTTGAEPYDADFLINITLPHQNAQNLETMVYCWDGDFDTFPDEFGFWDDPMTWGDPIWPILDSATGNMTIGLGLNYGTEVWASYQYSDIPLTAGIDYTINTDTGLITLLKPTIKVVNETVVNSTTQLNADISSRFFLDQRQVLNFTLYMEDVNTQAWTKLINNIDYVLDSDWGVIDLSGPLGTDQTLHAYYNASTIAKGYKLMADYSTTPMFNVALAHPYFTDVVIYNVTPISDTDFSIIPGRGDITFNQPLEDGSVFNASYKWYSPKTAMSLLLDNQNIVPGTLQFYIAPYLGGAPTLVPAADYVADLGRGAIILDEPQEPGTVYSANYQYYSWVTTVPVSITVLAAMGAPIGGEAVFSVVDEAVNIQSLEFVDDEFLFDTPPTMIVNETVAVSVNNTVANEFVISNPIFAVSGELLFTATGSEGIGFMTAFNHNYSTGNLIYNPSVTIYENGVPLPSTDYYVTYGLQTSGFGAGNVEFYIPPVAGALYTATYSYYVYRLSQAYLDHGDTLLDEALVSGTLYVYVNGVPLLPSDYTVDANAKISLRSGLYIQPLETMTASYSYTNRILGAILTYGTQNSPATRILPGSCKLYNNGILMAPTTANATGQYLLIEATGAIILTPPLGMGTLLTATYQHYPLINNIQLFRGIPDIEAIANGTLKLYNNGVLVEPKDNYTADYFSGTVTFPITKLPAPNSNFNASYAYYNPCLAWRNEMSLEDVPYGVNYIALNNNNIVPGSVVLKLNGVPLPANEISVDAATGLVNLLTASIYPGDAATASYNHVEPGMYSMMPGSMIGGGEYGDWRFYYLDIPNQGLNSNPNDLVKFLINAYWNNAPADVDLRIFMSSAQDTPPYMENPYPDSRYSSFTLTGVAASKKEGEGVFYTETGVENEYLSTNLMPGMILVAANNALSSEDTYLPIEINCGNIYLSESEITHYTDSLSGSVPFSLTSSMAMGEGMGASVLGPAISSSYPDQDVYKNDEDWYAYKDWPTQLAYGQLADEPLYLKAIDVANAATLEVHAVGHDNAPDIDIGVYLDGKNGCPLDGVIQAEEWMEESYQGGTAGSDEKILIVNPPDGTYLIRVFGFTLTQIPAQFDLTISMIVAGGGGYSIAGPNEDEELDDATIYTSSISTAPFEQQTLNINWAFPDSFADGTYGGVLYFGPKSSPELIPILISIILDRTDPVVGTTLPAENVQTSNTRPTISANLEEANMDDIKDGSLDPTSPRMFLDGVEVTSLCSINVPFIDDANTNFPSPIQGYPTGTITYRPPCSLNEGGHIIEVRFSDLAGNSVSKIWGFTVDSTMPAVSLDTASAVTYTNSNTVTFTGTLETGSTITVRGGNSTIQMNNDDTFTADVVVSDGENELVFASSDLAGNINEISHTVIVDKDVPGFTRIVALDGSTTNRRMTGIYGEMTEPGTLDLNGMPITVNSDGTFRYDTISLIEGQNMQALTFTDMAGNIAFYNLTITLDTLAPNLVVNDLESVVDSEWLNITGTTDSDATSLTVNGKLVDVDSTGAFESNIRISSGVNTIVVESKDRAGNSAAEIITVVYSEDAGTNYMAIGLMVVLLVIGLILGLLLAPKILGRKEEEPVPEEPWEEGTGEEAEPGTEGEPWEEKAGEEVGTGAEEAIEPVPELEGETPEAEGLEESPEETEELAPIPPEEASPEALPEEKAALESPPPEPDDPRIAKLTEAYESGKISKELYEKNLARFREQK